MPIDITERYKLIFSEHQWASGVRLAILRNWLWGYAAFAAAFAWIYTNQKTSDWIVAFLAWIFTVFYWILDIRNRAATRASHDIGAEIEKDLTAWIPEGQRFFVRIAVGTFSETLRTHSLPTTLRKTLLTHSLAIDLFALVMTVLLFLATLYLSANKGELPTYLFPHWLNFL